MQKQLLAGLLLLGGAVSAQAADWYVVGAVSQSQVALDKTALDNHLTTLGATGLASGDSGSTSNQWRLQLGYRLGPHFAVETGYIDLGKSSYDATFSGGSASADWTSGGIDIAALGTVALGEEFSLLGKIGVISAKTTTTWRSSGISGLPAGDVDETRTRPFLGIGAGYRLTPRTSLRLEYERFTDIGDAALTGNADVDILSLGASYQF